MKHKLFPVSTLLNVSSQFMNYENKTTVLVFAMIIYGMMKNWLKLGIPSGNQIRSVFAACVIANHYIIATYLTEGISLSMLSKTTTPGRSGQWQS